MDFLSDIYNALLPEAVLTVAIILCTISSFLFKQGQKVNYILSITGLVIALFSISLLGTGSYSAFYNSYISNDFSLFFKILIIIGALFTVFMSKKQTSKFATNESEYYILLLCATLGAFILTSANDLITLFIGLETLGLCSYVLSGYIKKDILSNEAAIKYLVFGCVASAVTLYGFSFIYGITGSTNYSSIANILSHIDTSSVLVLASIFVMTGIGFKLSAVPFHRWTPDVYQGSPTPIAAFLSVVSKIGGFVALTRLISLHFVSIETTSLLLIFLAILTMSVGNLMAIGQNNLKRLLAYSSIAQAGYIIAGLSILTKLGLASCIFYIITYLFMNLGAWAAVIAFNNQTGLDNIKDLAGLAKKKPVLAGCLSICLLSLAGIPITAGFFSKFYLFNAIAFSGNVMLLVICLLNTVVGLYYYMRVIKVMFFNADNNLLNANEQIKSCTLLNATLLTCTISVILIGLYSSPLIRLSQYISIKNDGQSNYSATHQLNDINKIKN